MANDVTSPDLDKMDQPYPIWWMLILPFYAGGFMALLIFPAAGDWRWLEGWLYIGSFALVTGVCYWIINQRAPRVLRNRAKTKKEGLTAATKESAGSDRFIMPIMGISFFAAMILPGLAHRYGWGSIPLPIEIGGLILSNFGYILFNTALLQNAYASKLLDINQGQQLVDTGLYGKVRHPVYTGGILMMFFVPIALGFWWALIPAAVACGSLVARIKYEEEMLVVGMEGYEDYQNRVKYKLIPGIH